MMRGFIHFVLGTLLVGCASSPDKRTLAELRHVEPDVAEIPVGDSLDKAMASYRRFLEEVPTNAKTPEAMRRLADLQIEKEYGIIGGEGVPAGNAADRAAAARPGRAREPIAAPAAGRRADTPGATTAGDANIVDLSEAEADFEARTTAELDLSPFGREQAALPPGAEPASGTDAGPRQAIETYQRILTDYPYYERNDQVLYQMARAYDELGEPDNAMAVMDRVIAEHGRSDFIDEVHFRRAEYFFVRRKYLDAEEAYSAVVDLGADSEFYELALYKLGWAFYKQELYEEALHRYMALLDYKLSIGYDFEQLADLSRIGATSESVGGLSRDRADRGLETAPTEDGAVGGLSRGRTEPVAAGEEEERRVADTFRVISLAFSNLGGPEVLNAYFSENGNRSYENRIYSNLGEFYLTKLRYNDAATVYRSFTELNPFHRVAPHFSMRVVEIYGEGGFAQLVVEAKEQFATRYGLNADYWHHFDVAEAGDVLRYLKTNLKDLASHYHSLYQDEGFLDEQPQHYVQALKWYREYLRSFPTDADTPGIHYQLADLLLEHEDFPAAALEYERTAYGYDAHEQSSAAGYAAIYAHREHLKVVTEEGAAEARLATVESSLRFASTFADHEHAATVLGAAAQDLYEMKDFERAIAAGTQLIEQHASAEEALRRAAWTVVAHASFDLALFVDAERAYAQVLALTPEEDEARQSLFDNLAAAIYKQGEAASEVEDHQTAAGHFLRIKTAAPTSQIRPSAEYDAAAALMKLEDWTAAAAVFRDFREVHTDHELQPEVTKQLAFVYRQAGELTRSAEEYERVATDAEDPELHREALLLAGELYEEAQDERALTVYNRYVEVFPSPVDLALEIRFKIAGMHDAAGDRELYHDELRRIVAIDSGAGSERTPRTRYLAGKSSLVLSELLYEHFTELALTQPFAESLAEKRVRMDTAMAAFEALVAYEVAEVTAAATFYMAEIYSHFGAALLASERPSLSGPELHDYELALEEEAFPFEERAIEVHEKNLELMAGGTFNPWVQESLDQLAALMPGRYAKAEISSGFLGPVEVFAYRSPRVDDLAAGDGEQSDPAASAARSEDGTTPNELAGVEDVSALF